MTLFFKAKKYPNGTIREWNGKKYKKVSGKWKPLATGKKKVVVAKKHVLRDFYGAGRHKYFKNKEDMKDFQQRMKEGKIGGKVGMKIKSTAGRISKGTKVEAVIDGKKYQGKVVASDGTSSKSPTKFDIEYKDAKGKLVVKKDIERDGLTRATVSWSEKKKAGLEKKMTRAKQENIMILNKDVDNKVQEAAKDLVMAHWDKFSNMVGKYYRGRVRGGWDANKFGFGEDDLRQETYLIVQRAATAFLTYPPKDKRASFVGYVKSFLKANLAATLMAGSGSGGHMKASQKDQLYIWFFKDTLDEYKSTHDNSLPADDVMVKILNKKRSLLLDEKGNQTIRKYEWTAEKVRNKKAQIRTMTSLDKTITNDQGDQTTLMSLLNDEELEKIGGRHKMDPWEETKKSIVRDTIKKAIKNVLNNPIDREITIRSYGLFIDENSPQEVRRYAQGQTSSEIARYINDWEKKRNSSKRWTANSVNDRMARVLEKLRTNEDFIRETEGFVVKSKREDKGKDIAALLEWVSIYDVVSRTLDEFIPEKKAVVTVKKIRHGAMK